jgi:hypothetical protein
VSERGCHGGDRARHASAHRDSERIFTKWGFREILEKKAATILQPDLCHAGGIMEARLIAGMAEAYYAAIAPHNPLGPISLAAGCNSLRRSRIFFARNK